MPSLHFAFSLLAVLFVAGLLRSRWRLLLYAYPLLMAFTLVYTGEHYLIDVVSGAGYAIAVHLGLARCELWWRGRAGLKSEALVADVSGEAAGAIGVTMAVWDGRGVDGE
jgi:membrane-associated phospholipid phosphatase